MIAALWMTGAFAATPWETTFAAEAGRGFPQDMPRTVFVVGREAEPAGAALCGVLDTPEQRCATEVLSARDGRQSDAWLAGPVKGLVYILRAVPQSGGVTVSVFRGSGNRIDWYAASPQVASVPRQDLDALQTRVERLEQAVATLKASTQLSLSVTDERLVAVQGPDAVEEPAPPAEPPEPVVEAEAPDVEPPMAMLADAVEAANALQPERAWELLASLDQEHAGSEADALADRLRRELGVLNRAGLPLDLSPWFVALPSGFDPSVPTLLVFFEAWCPHSGEAMPAVQALMDDDGAAGWQVVGITQQTRATPTQGVRDFVQEHGLSFPVGRDGTGEQARHYQVRGVPAAVALVDGTVRWRGHPAHIDAGLLERLRSAP
ncbi:MAG: TlpA family protein disulfide reductase [Myxococcales bacterium]|nr:TlpA family protein disulfide reductase [Myxococcales bacterium]